MPPGVATYSYVFQRVVGPTSATVSKLPGSVTVTKPDGIGVSKGSPAAMCVDVTIPRGYTGLVFVTVTYNDDGTGEGNARSYYTGTFTANGVGGATATIGKLHR
jgi:hypothetical protein